MATLGCVPAFDRYFVFGLKSQNDLRLMADKLEIVGKLSKEEIDWIRSKADWIDPIVSSTDELLGIRNHENSREQKEQYLSEKRYYW